MLPKATTTRSIKVVKSDESIQFQEWDEKENGMNFNMSNAKLKLATSTVAQLKVDLLAAFMCFKIS